MTDAVTLLQLYRTNAAGQQHARRFPAGIPHTRDELFLSPITADALLVYYGLDGAAALTLDAKRDLLAHHLGLPPRR